MTMLRFAPFIIFLALLPGCGFLGLSAPRPGETLVETTHRQRLETVASLHEAKAATMAGLNLMRRHKALSDADALKIEPIRQAWNAALVELEKHLDDDGWVAALAAVNAAAAKLTTAQDQATPPTPVSVPSVDSAPVLPGM